MARSLSRTLRFTIFTLVEYTRSGRILVELAATTIFFYIFLRRWTSAPPPNYFFSTVALFELALSFYTSASIMALGDRPQGYLILARRVGRNGYLLGLYLAVLAIAVALYGLISLATALYNPVAGLTLAGWLAGTTPLLLNVALLSALLALMAPMVLPASARLTVLALIAVAFSGSLIGGQTLAGLPGPLVAVLSVLRTIFSTPLLPAFTGFELALSRDYSGLALAIPLAQFSLTLGLLALALYAFARREIIFSGA
ncbi:MAG TPA: hypothetical protein PLO33_15665 [Kouleothrix sp.]|uniref:hypothetical protein n=1 Tax=Kouleothrix sp. TaxID=2779161 RepID=UPI002BEC8B68|nr:hypothetical protein [Kouleothrix sp.]HRC77117.1 hypothetical protein [Kouleothrix sp.]